MVAAIAVTIAAMFGIGAGVANAVMLPYAYYPSSGACNDAGLSLVDEGATNKFSCREERTGLWHLYIDE
ncbi:hypothetical protein [Rhodococcus sp. IEGM1428]|uniref:hypothetical protein n=1 Tax=Rhodococcus sp. IEGM1428 TaxID=3392191 RepID=UPI003D0A3C01